MQLRWSIAAAALLLAVAACGQSAATPTTSAANSAAGAPANQQPAQATPAANPAAGAPFTDAEKVAGVRAAGLTPAAHGQVVNACDERVTPNIYVGELGGALARAMVITVGGGPNMATCYGDGVMAVVLQQQGAGWRVVFNNQGGMLFSMPATHNGVHDLMWGGPGFSFPTFRWNGTTYVNGATVPDSAPTLRSYD